MSSEPDPLNPQRFASYARVSTAMQAEKQISIPAQQEECRRAVFAQQGLLIREFDDAGISGETMDRPGLQALLALAESGAKRENGATLDRKTVTRNASLDSVIVWKLDRLSRPNQDDDIDFLLIRQRLRKAGVSLVSVTEPWLSGEGQMDRLMGYLARGQSTVEALQRLERFRLGKRGVIDREGRSPAPPPYAYGYKDDICETAAERRRGRAWTVLEPQSSYVRLIFARYLGSDSQRDIARELNARGAAAPSEIGTGKTRTKRDTTKADGTLVKRALGWTSESVGKVLKNRTYAGFLRREGEWVNVQGRPQAHAPLISDADWQEAQRIREGRGGQRGATSESLFSGLLRCPVCHADGRETRLVVVYQYHTTKGHDNAQGQPYVSRQGLQDFTPGPRRYRVYRCQRAQRDHHSRGEGAVLAAETCAGWQISEPRVLRPLLALLRRWSAMLPAADRRQVGHHLTDDRTAGRSRNPPAAGLRADVDRQLAQIPTMRANYSDQQALGLITMEVLRERLAALEERQRMLTDRLLEMQEEKPPASLDPEDAKQLLAMLESVDATPLQRRDALAAQIAYIVPALDRKTLKVYLR